MTPQLDPRVALDELVRFASTFVQSGDMADRLTALRQCIETALDASEEATTPCLRCGRLDPCEHDEPAVSGQRETQWFDGPVADLPPRRPHITPEMLPDPEPTPTELEALAQYLWLVNADLEDGAIFIDWVSRQERNQYHRLARSAWDLGARIGRR